MKIGNIRNNGYDIKRLLKSEQARAERIYTTIKDNHTAEFHRERGTIIIY